MFIQENGKFIEIGDNEIELTKEQYEKYIEIQDWFGKEKMKLQEEYVKNKDEKFYELSMEYLLTVRDCKIKDMLGE